LRWLAAISFTAALPACVGAQAVQQSRYGGTLHVKLRTASVSLDPREWTPGSLASAASQKLASLVYDRLVTLDDHAKFQPALAIDWSHDAAARYWQFKLRPSVQFSDGSPLTPADVVASLQSSLGKGFDVIAAENGVAIRSAHPAPDLLEQLASGSNFIFRRKPDATLLGTGPFFVVESVAAAPAEANPLAIKPARIKFRANGGTWSGRPFVDFVEVTLGEPPLRQLLDLRQDAIFADVDGAGQLPQDLRLMLVVLQRPQACDCLDAAHACRHGFFGDDFEDADVADALHVRAAAKFF